MIQLTDAIRLMESTDKKGLPIPFELCWTKFNRSKKTGGEVRSEKNLTLLGLDRSKAQRQKSVAAKQEKDVKDPNHAENFTLNLQSIDTHQVFKVNLYLILKFNGEEVIY